MSIRFEVRLLLLLTVTKFIAVSGECIDVSNYARWSNSDTWLGQLIDGDFPDNANITITEPILLDVENPKELFSITIGEPNGMLVFSDTMDISLRAHYILIKNNGSLIIGTEECKHQHNVLVTLLGDDGDYNIPGFNEKFIGVDEGGTIELHGKRKHPWTKLTKTVAKLDRENGLIYRHSEEEDLKFVNSLHIHVFDKVSGMEEKYFKLIQHGSRSKRKKAVTAMETFVNEIEDGKLVALASQGKFTNTLSATDQILYDAKNIITNLTGSTLFNSIGDQAYAAVTTKGDTSTTVEQLEPETTELRSFFQEEKLIYIESSRSDIEFDIIDTTAVSKQILHLQDDVSSWEIGDRGPKYEHFGDFCNNMEQLDMRGEVGLLTRNIKIMGETDGIFGGHIKMLKGFKNAHFEGLELTKMGQNPKLGRYPIHFHMCEDVGPETYEKPSYIRGNSIHHTFARATTIHGTHNCTIQFNFVYDTLGHAIFLEDGGEKDNVFEWNLVGGQRQTEIILTDNKPTSYWITNPKNYVRNNIAFGAAHSGFWFVYPELPLGPSRERNFMQYREARYTAIYEFVNNTAHSSFRGLNVDRRLDDSGNVAGYNIYTPLNDPFNKSSGPKEVTFSRFTAYKNTNMNVWTRGAILILDHCSLADSPEAVTMMKEGELGDFINKCIIIGKSCNTGAEENVWNNGDLFGVTLRRGLVHLRGVYFDNITSNSVHVNGAIQVLTHDIAHSTTVHTASDVLFGFDDINEINGTNRVYLTMELPFDDDPVATFRDLDGSVTGMAAHQVVPVQDFLLTPACKIRDNWLMAACPYNYGKLRISGDGLRIFHASRDDFPFPVDKSIDPPKWAQFVVIVGGIYSYTIEIHSTLVSSIHIIGEGITRSDWVRIGVCIPRFNATFNLVATYFPVILKSLSSFTEVHSVEDVDSDTTGSSYMYDRDVGVLFLKMTHIYERTSSLLDTGNCPRARCSSIKIKDITGDLTDTKCLDRVHEKYNKTIQVETSEPFPDILPATASAPPEDWGAGMFQPVPDYP